MYQEMKRKMELEEGRYPGDNEEGGAAEEWEGTSTKEEQNKQNVSRNEKESEGLSRKIKRKYLKKNA